MYINVKIEILKLEQPEILIYLFYINDNTYYISIIYKL